MILSTTHLSPTKTLALALTLCGALMCAAMTPIAAVAADTAKKEAAFGGKGAGPFLTKEQLRSCLALKSRNEKADDDLAKERTGLAAVKDELTRQGDANKAELETLDRTNADAVAAYNDKAAARDQQIDAYEARVAAYNAKLEGGKPDHDGYTKNCNNRRYFEDDEIAINKGK